MFSDLRVVADESGRQGFETPNAYLQTADILVAQKHPFKPLEVTAHGALVSPISSPLSSTMNARKPYAGKSRKLIIAIDVGTTFSGVSYRYSSFRVLYKPDAHARAVAFSTPDRSLRYAA